MKRDQRDIESVAIRRRASFAALVAADVISLTGNALAALAIPWFVLATTGSAARTGITAAAGLIPLIISAFFGGALVDRIGHRRASIVADLASALTVALIPLLQQFGLLTFPILLALVFLGAVLDAPGSAARAALLPDLARLARLPLERANTLHELAESGAQFGGPLLAGLLIAVFSPDTALWCNAASFAASAVLVRALVPETPAAVPGHSSRYRADLMEGLRFVWNDGPIRAIFLATVVFNFVLSGLFSVALPFAMHTRYGSAAGLGLVVAAFGAGSVAGAIIYGVAGQHMPRRLTFLTAVLALGGIVAVAAALPPVPALTAGFFLGGLIAGPNGPLIPTVLQERTPAGLRGRVFGATTAIGLAGAPLGVIITGFALQVVGLQPTLIGGTIIFLSVVVALTYSRGLREIDLLSLAERPVFSNQGE